MRFIYIEQSHNKITNIIVMNIMIIIMEITMLDDYFCHGAYMSYFMEQNIIINIVMITFMIKLLVIISMIMISFLPEQMPIPPCPSVRRPGVVEPGEKISTLILCPYPQYRCLHHHPPHHYQQTSINVEICAMSRKKWHKLRYELTPHFLPLCDSYFIFQ